MGYLTRDERREEILQAAMRVALAEGFSAMTVRRIASEAGVATGQVHHHFTSGGELKSLAFIRLIRELLDADVLGNTPAGGHVYMPCSAAMTAGLNPTFASGEKRKSSQSATRRSRARMY